MDVITAVAIAAAVLLASTMIWKYRHIRNGKWHPTDDYRSRRYVDGRWEYREMTKEELDEWQDSNAW